jgi:glycosyltransferase involved in cell wall biosynthesis
MTSEIPAISIIIAAYNSGDFLSRTVASALGQTRQDFEIVIVDDGSTDGTSARARTIRDPRIRVIEQFHRGAPAALNAAVEAARGEFIAILDHDDLWHPTKLQRHLEFFAAHPEAQATFSWSELIDENDRRIHVHPGHWRGPISFAQLLEDYVVGSSSTLVLRRSAVLSLAGLDTRFPRCHDADLVMRIALTGPRAVWAVPEELTLYRRHIGQMSRDWRAMDVEWDRLLEKFRGLAPMETAAVEQRSRANMNRYFAYLAYEAAEFPIALEFLRRASRPGWLAFLSDTRNWKALAACLSGTVLPPPVHRRLEALAGMQRDVPNANGKPPEVPETFPKRKCS